jgi:1-acyl-sn-glycerol-3-phosphate acyltransferase
MVTGAAYGARVHRLASALRLIVGFLFVVVVSLVFFPALVLLLPSRVARLKATNIYGKIVGSVVVALAGVRLHWTHKERLDRRRPAIYLVNHTSALDAFLGIWMAPFGTCGVFKREITRTPFFGQVALLSGHLLLDRGNHASAVASMAEAVELMRANNLSALIFPEGTRSRDGRLQPFKRGFVHLAIAAKLPVVPIVLTGVHKNWKKGDLLDFHPTDVPVEVLEPIDTSSWTEATAGEHAEQARALFAARLPPDQQPLLAA